MRVQRIVRFAFFAHFLVGAFALIGWVQALSGLILLRMVGSPGPPPFFDWSLTFSLPQKRTVIIAFVIASCALFPYAVLWSQALRHLSAAKSARREEATPYGLFAVCVALWLLQIVGVVLLNRSMQSSWAMTTAVAMAWTVSLAAPLALYRGGFDTATAHRSASESGSHGWLSVALVAGMLGLMAWMFLPLLTGPLRLLNDQLTASEQTTLSTGVVENRDYIRRHAIYGLQLASSNTPADETATKRASYELSVPMTPTLGDWLKGHERRIQFDPRHGYITVYTQVQPRDFELFQAALEGSSAVQQLRILHDLTAHEQRYTSEEEEFIDKNWLELRWQIANRWAIHHHNFVFGPMNELSLGKAPASISFQYGYVNAIALIGVTKLLGGFTLDNYFRATFLFYPVYFVLLLWIGHSIVRHRGYTALLAVLALSSTMMLDYETILRAPGLSPLRHVLDLPVIGLMAWSWRTKYRSALVAAYLLTLVQMLLNREFGLFLLGALVAIEIVQTCEEGWLARRFELFCGALALAGASLEIFALRGISNYMASYYAGGFTSPPLPDQAFTGSLMAFAALYAVFMGPIGIDPALRKALLLLAFYCNGLFLYYVWGATPSHFLNLAPVYALLGVGVLKAALSTPSIQRLEGPTVMAAQASAVCLLLIPSWFVYRAAKADVDEVFRTHVVHRWNFKRAHAQSTMDPRPFEEAVTLVQKYEPTSKGIYLVSVFDNLLPMMADRYSAMPFFDMAWFLLTDQEFAKAEACVLDEKPLHLFVDHDILDDHSGEVADLHLRKENGEALRVESIRRIRRLEVLQDLFRAVSADYVRVAESSLIDVYERRPR